MINILEFGCLLVDIFINCNVAVIDKGELVN